ncbi:hypothetical protein [Sphingomonas humi]|uniref:Uncharacterized protein n=1 Tax=Sphingomonas humi TaxID=335630 RepID=A0ABP7RHL5_9SPHN
MLSIVASLLLAAAQAGSPATTSATPPADPSMQVKCRRLPVTGSLARYTKECRTLAEWAKLDEGNRESATKIQDRGLVVGCGSSPQGC